MITCISKNKLPHMWKKWEKSGAVSSFLKINIKPRHIDTNEHFWGSFGKYETETTARIIVMMCQENKNWFKFTQAELNDFCTKNRIPTFELEETGLNEDKYFTKEDSKWVMTELFITKCYRNSDISEKENKKNLRDKIKEKFNKEQASFRLFAKSLVENLIFAELKDIGKEFGYDISKLDRGAGTPKTTIYARFEIWLGTDSYESKIGLGDTLDEAVNDAIKYIASHK